jgi:anti-sigma regulatory factor (Ser/Thr protein kinase)
MHPSAPVPSIRFGTMSCRWTTPPISCLHLQVAAHAAALVTVRRAVRRWLSNVKIRGRLSDDVLTATGEAAANAVEHAYGPEGGWLEVVGSIQGDTVVIVVRDGGHWRRRSSRRGRGYKLMRALMDSVGVEKSDDGTTVTMNRRLRLP